MLYERTAISKKSEKIIENEITTLRDECKMSVDMFYRDPYMLDLLFYHRSLRRLALIELKLGEFEPQG